MPKRQKCGVLPVLLLGTREYFSKHSTRLHFQTLIKLTDTRDRMDEIPNFNFNWGMSDSSGDEFLANVELKEISDKETSNQNNMEVSSGDELLSNMDLEFSEISNENVNELTEKEKPTQQNKRYQKTTGDERDQILHDSESQATQKSTKYAVKIFKGIIDKFTPAC